MTTRPPSPFDDENAGVGTGPPDNDDESSQGRSSASWSSQNPSGFYQARDYVFETLTAAGWDLDKSDVSRALNQWASDFERQFGSLPGAGQVVDAPEPWVLAQRAALRSDLLPTTFIGEGPDGTQVVYENRPSLGPLPVAFPEMELPTTVADSENVSAAESAALQRDAQSGPTSPDFVRSPATGQTSPRPSGVLTMEYVQSILNMAAMNQQPSGSTRSRLAFDRAKLEEHARDKWRTWLREEPPNVAGLVSDYISDASSFWRGEGGQLDFDTWLSNRLRTTGRYNTLYANMDPTQSEEEYLQGFLSAEQFGLKPGIANEHVVRGLRSGAAPASFAESVGRSRDVMALGQGSFSRRFANLLSQMGPLQRS